MSGEQLFELELHGGPAEERYRRLRPEIEAFDWDALAPDEPPEALAGARQQWTAASLQEYATAGFHALSLHLMLHARVPLDFSGMMSRFPLDEIAHAELCARVAGALGGGAPVSYAPKTLFDPADASHPDPLLVLTARIVRDCCVSETVATEQLRAAARAPGHPVLKKIHAAIAKDEALHGRFGWIFLEWAAPKLDAAQRKGVASEVASAVAILRGIWDALLRAPPEPWGVCGNLEPKAYVELGERSLRERVLPGLQRLGLAP